MDIKISKDGSAELLLTPNPLPRNFNYKIIIKIQASINGKNSKNRPLDKLEEYAVLGFENTTFLVG